MQTQAPQQPPYPPSQSYPPPPQEKKSSKTWLYVVIGIVVLCVICGAIGAIASFVLPNFIKKNTDQITQQLENQVKTVEPASGVVETITAELTPETNSDTKPTDEATSEPATNTSSEAPNPSGYVDQVIMATGVKGDKMEPTGETTTFKQSDTFHAVVVTSNAPANTKFEAVWYAVDVGSAVDPNTKIDQTDLTTEGSRNLDFSLKPNSKWPKGNYKVNIFVDGTLDQVVEFTVE